MDREHTGALAPTHLPHTGTTALLDLHALVEEIGGSYPLLGYATPSDEQIDEETLDPLILAGLVNP